MTKEQLIKFLRTSVSVQTEDVTDTEYLTMSDEDLENFMLIVLTRDFSEYKSLDRLPSEAIYPLMMLTKKELYYALAVKEAPEVDLGADGAYLKQSDRYNHYLQLIQQIEEEYQSYLDNGGAGSGTLVSFDVILPNRYNTKRNYEKGSIPAPFLYIESANTDSIECSWNVSTSRFKKTMAYLSTESILDLYDTEKTLKVDEEKALMKVEIKDVHQNRCRFKRLQSNTTYFVTLAVFEMSGLIGYAEETAKTAEIVEVGE